MNQQHWNTLVCLITFVIFHPPSTLSAEDDKTSHVDDLCGKNIQLPAGYIELDSIVHPSISTVSYRLYKANNSQALNWCQSYHACQKVSLNSELAVLSTRELQQSIRGLDLTGVDHAWIAGNKQQIGWKWIQNDTHFADYNPITSDEELIIVKDEDHSVCGSFIEIKRNISWVYAFLCSRTSFSACFINGRVSQTTTKTNWYDGMNNCINISGRLATGSEIRQSSVVRTIGVVYWMALHKNPWVWMTSDEDIKPVMYSSWRDANTPGTLRADCMTLNTEGQWEAKPCGDVVDYFICEVGEDPADTTSSSEASTAGGSTAGGSTAGDGEDPLSPTSSTGASTAGGSTAGGSTAGGSTAGGSTAGGSILTIIVPVVVGVIILVIIIVLTVVVVLVCKRRKMKKSKKRGDNRDPSVNNSSGMEDVVCMKR